MVTELSRRSFAIGAPAAGVCTLLAIDKSSASPQIGSESELSTSVYDGFPAKILLVCVIQFCFRTATFRACVD